MKLRHCRNLTTAPDFTEMVNLEKLILEGCVSLVKLHPSIGMLKKLVMLNMRDCIQIRSFPCKVEMDSLQVLILLGCLKLDNLTQVSGTLKSLVKLCVDGTAITGFPSFISSLTNLQVLEIGRYQQTESPTWWTWWTSIFQKQPQSLVLPSLASLRLLTELNVRNCNISEVCHDIGALSCLELLDLSGNNFTKLPGSLSQLFHLRKLSLDGCKKLEVLPELPPSISVLDACHCISLQELPRLDDLRYTPNCNFYNCPKIFGNVTIDGQVSMLQTPLIDSSTTSHASTNQISFLVKFIRIQRRSREFFRGSSSRGAKNWYIISNGNRIPRWFTNKSKGSHDVKVELPPNWCYSKFKGYGICVVFTPKESFIGPPRFSVNNFDGTTIDGFFHSISGKKQTYYADTVYQYFSTWCSGWKEAKNFVTFSFRDVIEDMEVKECGVRLVCDDEDLKEEEETIIEVSRTPHASTNQISFLVRYFGIQNKIREFFRGSSSTVEIELWREYFAKKLYIISNGNRIPRWFTNKSKGSHDVKVELPSNWCYSKFKGYGICVVFTPKESFIGPPRFSVNNFDGTDIDGIYPCSGKKQTYYADTMIFLYFSAGRFGWKKAKNFVKFSFGDTIEEMEVKEWGVRLVCDDDEDLKEETVLSIIQHLPPQTQPTGGYFMLFNSVNGGSSWSAVSWSV